MDLSVRARRICAEHWNDKRGRCVGCPIERACSTPVAKPLTMVNVNKHVRAVNEAAEVAGKAAGE